MKNISYYLIVSCCIFVVSFCSNNNSNHAIQNEETYFSFYLNNKYTSTDTIINYHFSNDSLYLDFLNPPEVKSWKFYIGIFNDYIGDAVVINSKCVLVNERFKDYSDTSKFRLLGVTKDSILFGYSRVKIDFPFYSVTPGRLKSILTIRDYYRINLNGLCASPDFHIREKFRDSIISIFDVDSSLLFREIPEIKTYLNCSRSR